MIFKVAFARVPTAWRTLDQLSIFIVQFVSIDPINVAGKISGVVERFGILPFLVKVWKRLRRKQALLYDSVFSCQRWIILDLITFHGG